MLGVGEVVEVMSAAAAAERLAGVARLAAAALQATSCEVWIGVAEVPAEVAAVVTRARASRAVEVDVVGETHHLALPLRWQDAVVGVMVARGPRPWPAGLVTTLTELVGLVVDDLVAPRNRASYAHASAILASSRDAIIGKTLDGIVTSWNLGAEVMFGLPAASILGRSIAAIVPPARLDEETALLARVARGEVVEGFDSQRRRVDGHLLDVSIMLSPILVDGQVAGVASVVRDVTERRAAERTQARILAERNAVFEHAGFGVVQVALDGAIVAMNHAAERMLGYTARELIERAAPGGLIDPAELAARAAARSAELGASIAPGFEVIVARAARGLPSEEEWTYQRKDGTRFPAQLTITPLRDADEKIVGYLGLIADLTARKQAEQELRERESWFRLTFEHAGIGQAIVGLDGRWLVVNAALCTMLGYTQERLRELTFHALSHPEDAEVGPALVRSLLAGELPAVRADKRYRRADGSYIWCRLTSVLIRDAAGTPLRFFSQLEDITARKQAADERLRLERKLAETAKLESLGILAGGIAHDFNNLLTGVLGNASLLRLELPPQSPHLGPLGDIEEAARRAAELCRQMLAYSGRGRFVVERVDVNALITTTARLLELSISKQVVLRFHLAAMAVHVDADATQLRQIIMNLVINASEAIGARSGVIAIATGMARLAADEVRGLEVYGEVAPGDYVTIEVSDDGDGMDAETLSRIFDPFFTTKFTGRGLGLAAVQGIVRGHKGALRVYSEVGKGTTFRLLFPAATSSAVAGAAVAPAAAPGPSRRGTVLVVDDDESVRTVAARLLERMGFTVVLAADGREGVARFAEDPARFGLVLLDLTMPHLDGEETFRQLRHLRPGVRVILTSGFSHQEVITRFAGKGLAGFVQKPFEAETLMAEVRKVLGDP